MKKNRKSSIVIIVLMTICLLMAVFFFVYSFIASESVPLYEKYSGQKELAVNNLLDKLYACKEESGGTSYYLIASYDTTNEEQKDIAYSYDNALCAIALLSEGKKEEALCLLDSFVYAATCDRGGIPRIRNAYLSGNIMKNGFGAVSLPGHYDYDKNMWIENPSLVGSSSGNIAWVALAMLWYDKLYGEEEDTSAYVRCAALIMDWIIDNCYDENDGFIAGIDGWIENGEDSADILTYKSVEHNVDCMVVFDTLYGITGEQRYLDAADNARSFVEKMYDKKIRGYYTGTGDDGITINTESIVLDAQVWTALAIGNKEANAKKLGKTISKMKTSEGGYAFSISEAGGGYWTEGTAFTALYLLQNKKRNELNEAIDALLKLQLPDGRFPACSGYSINTGMAFSDGTQWKYINDPHIAAQAWFIMAVNEFNPFGLVASDEEAQRYRTRIEQTEESDTGTIRNLISEEKAVIHAGGTFWGPNGEQYNYSNSSEALINACSKGNKVCEMDFLLTADGYLVCAHNSDSGWALGFSFSQAPDHTAFMNARFGDRLHTMDLDTLVSFMRLHPDLYIVTDIKSGSISNLDGCRMIAEKAPDLKNRFIVQIYHTGEYESIHDLGFPYIIYTMYETGEDERNLLKVQKALDDYDFVWLCVPYEWVDDYEFVRKIIDEGYPVMVHTVNDIDKMNELLAKGVTGFYTDNTSNENLR